MKVKVACCWDDGVYNDIRLTALLRQYGAKATFNLNPGFCGEETIPAKWYDNNQVPWDHWGFIPGRVGLKDMREIYDGFQVASHCWCHELPDENADKFMEAAIHARKYLEDLFQQECRGFAWPCGRFTDETIQRMHEAGFAYGRTTRNTTDVTACPEAMTLDSSCSFKAGDFYSRYEAAKAGSGVFYFWGHSYEMLDYEPLWQQFENRLRYICNDPDSEWVDVIDLVPLLH